MDGILSGLTSIVPVMPDKTVIPDRSGMSGPPVEIMPLPADSFLSDDAAAELLNTPFSLNPDKDQYGGDIGRPPVKHGRTAAPDDPSADALLNEAYTLSLGNDENAPLAPKAALEMSRMKNYEALGRAATRQTVRKNHGSGGAANVPVQNPDSEAAELEEKVRSLLSQLSAGQNELVAPAAPYEGYALPAQTPGVDDAAPSPNARPPKTAGPGAAQPPVAGRDLSFLSKLAGLQLSASDLEVILTLEPDLQEALLNMLSGAAADYSGRPSPETPYAPLTAGADVPAVPEGPDVPAAPPGPEGPAAPPGPLRSPVQPDGNLPLEPGSRQALAELLRRTGAPVQPQAQELQVNAAAAAQTDEELTRLAAGILLGARAPNAAAAAALVGDIINLKKVKELPYSLYVFGSAPPERRGDFDEEDGADVLEEQEKGQYAGPELLRISEAVKMAAVLHNLYYGGSGRFPEETPWYAPYVRYAVKNRIINSNDFSDYNDYATRAETAYIFSNCVPRAEFPIINYVSDIPDVMENYGYGGSIFLLLRAGVLQRKNKDSSFYPERLITKTEAAALIGRIATPTDRKRVLNT